ncbi:hypothetical protein DXG01_016112, partial [Tephrocybe rancida]
MSDNHKAYTLLGKLQGHQGAVLCISATEDGKIASGGESVARFFCRHIVSEVVVGADGVRIFDLRRSGKVRFSPVVTPVGVGIRGATTALAWIQREDEPDDGLVYGTQAGYVVCWKQSGNGF